MTETLTLTCILPDEQVQQEKKALLVELQQLRSDLLLSQPFIAVLAMRLKLVVVADDRLATACTDSHNVFFKLDFIKQCSSDQKRFVLAHEVWHCVMGHFFRQQQREMRRWNFACDYEVNAILQHYFLHKDMPNNVLFSAHYLGKSAEQIYVILGKLSEDDWAETLHWQGSELPIIESQFDQHLPELGSALQGGIRIDPDFQLTSVNEQDVHRWREYTAAAAQVTGVLAGSHSAGLQNIINNVLSPQLSWSSLLQRFIQRTINGSYSWHRPARRYLAQGLYMPGRQGTRLTISLAIDTSGSTMADLPQFLAEMTSILHGFDQVRLQVISCDMAITDVSYYEKSDLPALKKWQAKGGGGTQFTPVFRFVEQGEGEQGAPQVLIFFTDGFGAAPSQAPAYPVIWVLTREGSAPVPWGEVIRLS
ncbi:hypothetical protein VT06_15275 [Arsukibacterium sp. MJ3]|uniref:vWA domain-containing protein n=1 Tax=Arsukibacterium sp. MJ3 TaxID=1632859 RepID=UPI000626FA18|nr:VWA-like domain-containing protein [Arsukibacterium sp. MJ3]KKO47738.1 hypothetical protein VT06_15275 [Arsukibacterium sp. MJ3]